jgi:hypothetical protein
MFDELQPVSTATIENKVNSLFILACRFIICELILHALSFVPLFITGISAPLKRMLDLTM